MSTNKASSVSKNAAKSNDEDLSHNPESHSKRHRPSAGTDGGGEGGTSGNWGGGATVGTDVSQPEKSHEE